MSFIDILVLLIKVLHTLIVLFVVLAPFQNIPVILFIHAMFSILLLFHWYAESDVCFLTYLEAKLTDKKVDQGFIYKIIAPFYNISKLKIIHILWTGVIFLLFISLHKLLIYYYKYCTKIDTLSCIYNAYSIKNNI